MKALALIILAAGVLSAAAQLPTFDAPRPPDAVAVPVLDADMRTMLALVGGTTAAMSNYLNTFYTTLKASNTFAKLQGLGAFPFANAGSNGQPFIAGQPLVKWSGTFTANDSTGITGNGTDAYADTQFRTSTNQNAGSIYVYCKTDAGVAFVAGATGSARNSTLRHIGAVTFWTGQFNDPNGQTVALAEIAFPCGLMITRSSSAVETLYVGTNSAASSANTSTTPPDWNIYLCADNNAGVSGGSNPTGWSTVQLQGWAVSTNTLTAADKAALDKAFADLGTSMAR